MSISFHQLALYGGALLILFLVPGPVWAALIARAMSGGFKAAWPLAAGVVVGDGLWPVLAVFGVTWLVSLYAGFLTLLRMGGAAMLVLMGLALLLKPARAINDEGLGGAASGPWAAFSTGVLVILGNPKAILFYMGMLPGFFDIRQLNGWDIAAIALVSMTIPFSGNLLLALFLGRARNLISSPEALRRVNMGSGIALICVGAVIALG